MRANIALFCINCISVTVSPSPLSRSILDNSGIAKYQTRKLFHGSRPFDETWLTPPLGSGPYRLASVDPGRTIRFWRELGESLLETFKVHPAIAGRLACQ